MFSRKNTTSGRLNGLNNVYTVVMNGRGCSRVDDVERSVNKVRKGVHVTLPATTSSVFTEAAFEGEAVEHVFDVVK